MNDLCTRCLLTEINGAYCPRCGRSLRVQKHVPSVDELEQFEQEVRTLLPRLRQLHMALDDLRSEATRRRCFAAVQLVETRQTLMLRIAARLEEHLRFVERELHLRNRGATESRRAGR